MASIFKWLRQPPPRSRRSAADAQNAQKIFEQLDRCRNLPTSAAILAFFVAACIGVLSFFVLLELTLRLGINKQIAWLFVSLCWVMTFPVWVLTFLAIIGGLDAVGVRDVKSILRFRLLALGPGRRQPRDLTAILASRRWRHREIYRSVVAELSNRNADPDPGRPNRHIPRLV